MRERSFDPFWCCLTSQTSISQVRCTRHVTHCDSLIRAQTVASGVWAPFAVERRLENAAIALFLSTARSRTHTKIAPRLNCITSTSIAVHFLYARARYGRSSIRPMWIMYFYGLRVISVEIFISNLIGFINHHNSNVDGTCRICNLRARLRCTAHNGCKVYGSFTALTHTPNALDD